MMKRAVLFVVFVLALSSLPQAALSQKKPERYNAKIILRPGLCVNFVSSQYLSWDKPSDYLVDYSPATHDVRLFAASYFFSKNWGVDFSFNIFGEGGTRGKYRGFEEAFAEMSDVSQYYPDVRKTYNGVAIAINVGMSARLEFGRFFIYPGASMGFRTFSDSTAEVYLKKKDSNEVIRVSYRLGDHKSANYNMTHSLSFGYKLNDRLYFNIDAIWRLSGRRITYERSEYNVSTGSFIGEDTIRYPGSLSEFGLGFGIMWVIFKR